MLYSLGAVRVYSEASCQKMADVLLRQKKKIKKNDKMYFLIYTLSGFDSRLPVKLICFGGCGDNREVTSGYISRCVKCFTHNFPRRQSQMVSMYIRFTMCQRRKVICLLGDFSLACLLACITEGALQPQRGDSTRR